MSQTSNEENISISDQIRSQLNRPLTGALIADFDKSSNQTKTTLFRPLNSSRLSQSNSSHNSYASEYTINTAHLFTRELECSRLLSNIQGLELQYNNLIICNKQKDDQHFSVLNNSLRQLLEKTRFRKESESIVAGVSDPFGTDLVEEVSVSDIMQILNKTLIPFRYRRDETESGSKQQNDLSHQYDNTISNNTTRNNETITSNNTDHNLDSNDNNTDSNSDEKHETTNNLAACTIPEKYRNKKLPHLDRKQKTGYIKFFDVKNNFGFMALGTEPFGDVFVFGREFLKANIDPQLILEASGNPTYVFKFKVMYYKGRHGESKKAVSIKFSGLI